MGKIDEVLHEIEQEVHSRKRFLPIVGPEKGKLLYTLALLSKPKRILELGTLVGYSALWLAKAAPKAKIETIELDEKFAKEAEENFARAGVKNVRVILGDALKVPKRLKGPYDFIFMDIWKEAYVPASKLCIPLLKKGGTLVADNASWDEVKQYREFMHARADLSSILIPIGDGQ